jgi:predicted metalloprotease
VIAQREDVGAGVIKLIGGALGDAEAARGVFRIDDDEIELRDALSEARQVLDDPVPARLADHVSEKSNAHGSCLPIVTGI